jgi:hypothetical protein
MAFDYESGAPTGEILSLASTSVSAIAEYPLNEEVTITLDALLTLDASTDYCLLLEGPQSDGSNYIRVWGTADPLYGDGEQIKSADGGSSWTEYANYDMAFRINV